MFARRVWIPHCKEKGEVLQAHGEVLVEPCATWVVTCPVLGETPRQEHLAHRGYSWNLSPTQVENQYPWGCLETLGLSESISWLGGAWLCFHSFLFSSCCPGGICSQKRILLLISGQSLWYLHHQKWCWATAVDKCRPTVQGKSQKSNDPLRLSTSWAVEIVSWEFWSCECAY